MSKKAFYTTSGIVFLVVTVVHFLRVMNGWDLTLDTYSIPMWWSWVVVLFLGYMSYQGLSKGK